MRPSLTLVLPSALAFAAGQAAAQVVGIPELPSDAPVELIVDGLIADFADYNSGCRGGSGDSSDTWAKCSARDYAGYVLGRLGWCLNESGDPTDWTPCDQGGSRLERPTP